MVELFLYLLELFVELKLVEVFLHVKELFLHLVNPYFHLVELFLNQAELLSIYRYLFLNLADLSFQMTGRWPPLLITIYSILSGDQAQARGAPVDAVGGSVLLCQGQPQNYTYC